MLDLLYLLLGLNFALLVIIHSRFVISQLSFIYFGILLDRIKLMPSFKANAEYLSRSHEQQLIQIKIFTKIK